MEGEIDTNTLLHKFVKLQNVQEVRKLLKIGASIQAQNSFKNTPFHYALKTKNKEIIRAILNKMNFADIEYFNSNYGLTPLLFACLEDDPNRMEPILRTGINVNQPIRLISYPIPRSYMKFLGETDENSINWSGYTYLHVAVENQCPKAVHKLLHCGAQVDVEDANRITPMHLAVESKNSIILNLLLSAECKKCSERCPGEPIRPDGYFEPKTHNNIMRRIVNLRYPSGESILHVAVKNQCLPVLKMLLLHGAAINMSDNEHLTPLHVATKTGNSATALMLLRYRVLCNGESLIDQDNNAGFGVENYATADVNAVDDFGKTPLHYIAEHDLQNISLANVLLNHGADVCSYDYTFKWTPLLRAASKGMREIVKLMASRDNSYKRNINPTDDTGFSHFHAACMRDDADIVEAFLENGAEVYDKICMHSTRYAGYTPLHFAAENNCPKVAKLLIKREARIEAKISLDDPNYRDHTPLIRAVVSGSVDVLKVLGKYGADANARDYYDGNNALHIIMMEYFTKLPEKTCNDIIKILVGFGCDVNASNTHEKTPLEINVENASCTAFGLKALLENGADINRLERIERIHGPARNRPADQAENRTYCNCSTNQILRSHIIKLEVIDNYVEDTLLDCRLPSDAEHHESCLAEVEIMKNTKINDRLTLANILMPIKESSETLREIVRRSKLKQTTESEYFSSCFKNYGHMIKLQLRRGLKRIENVNRARLCLKSIINLPDICCEEIVTYLSDACLEELIRMTEAETKRRKRSRHYRHRMQ